MGTLEQEIKDFVKDLDVDIVGIAGPERLNGPPSMDPTYCSFYITLSKL